MIVFPKSLSIRTQLFALVVAVLLPTVGVFLWFFSIDAHEAREAAHARAGLLAYSTATRVNEFLEGQRQILAALAQRPTVQAMDSRQCDPVVAEHVHMFPGLGDVVVWDRRGNAVCAYGKPVVAAAEVVSKAWFREGIEGDKFRVSDVMPGSGSMPWVVMLTVPVLNGQGEAVGLISLPVDLLMFSRRLFASLPVAAAISVVDRRRDFLMRSLMPEAFIGKPGPAGIIAELRGQKEGTFSTDGVDGVRRLVTFVSIPSVDWMVFVGVPEGEVLAAIRARQRNAMVFGFAALLPMLLLAYLIARAIARPIQDLAVVSAKVAGGNLAARILPHGPDEIVAVAHQFNHMLDVRERSEAALTDSAIGLDAARQFTQATMDALSAHICVLDEGGIIVSVNAAWRGADAAGAVPLQPIREGVNYCALCATAADAAPVEGPNYPHLFTIGLQQVLTRQCDHFAMEYPSPSAEGQLWFLARITRFRGDGLTRAVVAFENITDLKRAEERVVLSEHRLNLVLMGTNDGWWDWDLTTGQRFYSVRWWGMLGYEPDELSTADALDEHLMHPEDRVRFQRFLRSVLDGQEDNYEVEFRLLHKNGREVPLLSRGHILRNASGRPIRVSGMNTDLTARKEAEQALRASEERWKLVLEGAGDGGWDWNIETNEVIHSRRWKAMLGYAENEVPDSFRAWSDLVYPPDMPGIMGMLQPHLEGRTPTYRHEYRMLCKDGTWKWILDRGTVVTRDATGKPLRMVGTHIDLTRRKVVELALNETKERLA
ncbi:MAG: PAS domain-containing protein, partial [Betaproteobacteria bacterium]|nr:PAS domain-containing protein [Betaproteobacteria bacterium]